MPVPASDAIASDVGHGALGVRYALRPFRDLLSETVGQRHLWVELRPKKVLATWTGVDSNPVTYWSKAVAETFDGVVLDVVGVKTLTETLSRVESQARCAATAGTFYYTGSTLYIHLTGDADPAATTVAAELGIHVGSHGVHQPVLLPDRLANGSLDAWTGTAPDGWTVVVGAGITLDKTTSDSLQGSYAARFTLAASTLSASLGQSFTTLAAGMTYRFSGAYRNACSSVYVQVYVDDTAGTFLMADGRTQAASTTVVSDVLGGGEWRRFAFDFLCPSWATVRVRAYILTSGGAQSGTVDFDDLKLQPVSRFAYHEPLLSVDSLPTIEAARADSFWGEMSSALGSLSLLNGGGRLEPLLAAYDWLGADAIVRVGGRYQVGANETLIEDCPIIASGKLGAPTVTDSGVTFDLEDDRSLFARELPLRTYNNNATDAYTQPDRGRVRPLLFGYKGGIRPVQYDITTPYAGAPVPTGVYEAVDCTDWSAGIKQFLYFDWYDGDGAAKGRSSVARTRVDGLTDYSDGITRALTTGRFTVLRDQRPLFITEENNKVYFNVGGATLTAAVAAGTYVMYDNRNISGAVGLLKDLASAMNTAAGTADIACTFTDTTQKVRIGKGAGTLSLLCATGADVQNGIWAVLGFNAAADKTGALAYDADNVFTSQAFDQTLRIDATGFADDASGTYTGTASAAIEKAPDIARFILRVLLGVPASAIDAASFVAARAGAGSKQCGLYIGSPRTVASIFEELETTGDMDLVLNGGVWYCLARDTSVPAGTPDLVDADFLSFEAGYAAEDLFGTVVITYSESPDNPEPIKGGNSPWSPTANTEAGEKTDATVALRYNRPHQRTFNTSLGNEADAALPYAGSRLEAIASQAQTKRRRFRFTTKGKALQVPVSGKIRLTRSRGLDTTGALSQVLVRVLSKRDDWARWVSDVEAIEVV